MRFWGKSRSGEKKTSREKLICGGGDSVELDSADAAGTILFLINNTSIVFFYASVSQPGVRGPYRGHLEFMEI